MALALPGIKIEAGKIYTVFAVGTVTGTGWTKAEAVWAVAMTRLRRRPAKRGCAWLHAVPDAPAVSIFVNDELAFFSIAFREITGYATLDAGVRTTSRSSQRRAMC